MSGDDRDEKTWVVYELTHAGESLAAKGGLEGHIESIFGDPLPEIFVPCLSYRCDGRLTLFNVMEGYCFVSSELEEQKYLHIVESSPYLWKVLHTACRNRSPALTTVANSHVRSLQHKLSEMCTLSIGMRVQVRKGICKGLEGKVVGLSGEQAHVLISLRTLKTIRTIHKFAILPLGEDTDG
jgi:hypothetical protein